MQKKIPNLNVDKYRGKWVALNPITQEVFGANQVLEQAEQEAKRKGLKRPLMYPVPQDDAIFIGGHIRILK